MPTTRARVMPPKEELNSLGNFWQALGDKPRMVLNYSVTLPIELEIAQAGKKSVKKTELEMKK
nr:Pvc16 family protein [Vibrio sagamiensis]